MVHGRSGSARGNSLRPMQDELPDAMARLRYPMTLTRSSLLAVGAPTKDLELVAYLTSPHI